MVVSGSVTVFVKVLVTGLVTVLVCVITVVTGLVCVRKVVSVEVIVEDPAIPA